MKIKVKVDKVNAEEFEIDVEQEVIDQLICDDEKYYAIEDEVRDAILSGIGYSWEIIKNEN